MIEIRPSLVIAGGLFVLIGAGLILVSLGLLPPTPNSYTSTTVTVETDTETHSVTARVADTSVKRFIGLSRTDSLAEDEGMIFVHSEPGEYAYEMRNMAFGIDIVFIDESGCITSVESAPADASTKYRGYGKWVLEAPYGWADRHDISAGACVTDGLPAE